MAKRISFTVSGHVQGVFFRKFTTKQATNLGITGFVQNDSGGTVSGEAQGDASALDKFVKELHQGPSAAQVSKVDQNTIPTKEGESGFRTTG